MARHGNLRASDAERERVVQRLHDAATEGRLSPDELDERTHRALIAVTYADLDAVVDDLPRPPRTGRTPARQRTVGGWALATVRANPLLLVCMIPVLIAAGAMLLAAAVTWMTLVAVTMILGGAHHRRAFRARRGPWALMWGAGDRW